MYSVHMWLLLVAAGSGYLVRCWQRVQRAKSSDCGAHVSDDKFRELSSDIPCPFQSESSQCLSSTESETVERIGRCDNESLHGDAAIVYEIVAERKHDLSNKDKARKKYHDHDSFLRWSLGKNLRYSGGNFKLAWRGKNGGQNCNKDFQKDNREKGWKALRQTTERIPNVSKEPSISANTPLSSDFLNGGNQGEFRSCASLQAPNIELLKISDVSGSKCFKETSETESHEKYVKDSPSQIFTIERNLSSQTAVTSADDQNEEVFLCSIALPNARAVNEIKGMTKDAHHLCFSAKSEPLDRLSSTLTQEILHATKESELIVAGEDRLQLPFFPARSSTNVATLNFQKDIYGDGFNWKKRKSLSQINVDILRREAFAMESNMGYFPKFKCLEGIGSFPFHSESIRMDSCRKSSSRNARSFSKSSRSQQFIRRSSSPCISSKPFSSSEKICRAHSSVQLFHHKARIPGFLNLHADPEHQCQYAYCDELRNTIRVSNAVFTSMTNILGSVWPRNGSTITDLAGNLRPFFQPCSSSAANVELQRVDTHSFLVKNKKRKISKGIARSASRDFQEVEDNVEVPAQALMEALLFSFGVGVGVLHLLCANNGNHGNLVPQQISLIQTGNGFLPEKSHHLEGAEENHCLDLREKEDLEAGHRHEFLRSTDSFACSTEVFSQQGDGCKSVSCEFELEAQTQGCMNELEAEFQAELDMMKQSFIDISTCMQAGEFSDISERELHCMGGARSAELSNGHIKVVNGETGTASSQVAQRYQAVSPRELDRRLRIVLQTRQEERISELEAEVTALKQELNAKEQEFQSYKDRVCQLTLLSTASNLSREPDSNEIIVCEKKTMDTQLNRPPFSNHFHGSMALGVLSDESQLVHLQQKSLSGQDSMEDKISKHMRIPFGKRGEELTQVLPGTFQGEDSRLRIHSGNPANDIRTVCHSRLQESVVVNMKANSEEATSSTYCVLDNSSNYSSKCGYSTVISDSICGDSLRDTAIFRVSEQTEVDKCERQETYIQMTGVKDNSTEWRYLETSKKKMVSETDKLCVPISDIYDRNDRFTIVRKGSKSLIHPENSQVYTDHSENERATCVPAVCVEEEFYQTRRKNGKADAPASTPVGSSHRSKQVMFEVCKGLGKEDLPLYSLEGETESFPVIREFGNFLEPLSQSICHSKSHAFGEDNSASDSEESLGEELIKQIVQKTRSGSSLLKDAQMILNMLENDDRCQYY